MTAPRFEFFYDLHSPYAYLAHSQMHWVEDTLGLEVQWRPFLLGGVFKATENRMPARVPAKAAYMLKDLRRWARWYGQHIHYPDWFPGNSLNGMRCCTAAFAQGREQGIRFTRAAYRAAWVDNMDLSVPEALVEVAALVGLDGRELFAQAQSASTKDRLRETTEEAVRRGAFGAPTFFVGDEMFWGNDRLEMAVHHARSLMPAPEPVAGPEDGEPVEEAPA